MNAMRSIIDLPSIIWSRLASIVGGGVTAHDLRSSALCSSSTTVGCLHRELFQELGVDPLAMVQGDIGENLNNLLHREVSDPTVQKMRSLLRAGVPAAQLRGALELLRDAPCTVQMIEEAHACAAWVMREHPALNEAALLARSTVSQLRPFFTKPKHELALEALERKLAILSRRQPHKVTARHLLFGSLAKRAAPAGTMTQVNAMSTIQTCMKSHMEVYAGLGLARKVDVARARDVWVAQQKEELERTEQAIIEQRDELVQSQWQLKEQNGVPNRIGSSRFSDDGLLGICRMLGDVAARNEVHDRWLAKTSVPPVPEADAQRVIEAAAARIPAQHDMRPWWCARVAANRDLFRSVAFSLHPHENDEAFLFLFAKQKPVCATFLRLRRRPFVWPDFADRAGVVERPWHKIVFDDWPMECMIESSLPFVEGDQIYVWMGLNFEDRVVSTCHKRTSL